MHGNLLLNPIYHNRLLEPEQPVSVYCSSCVFFLSGDEALGELHLHNLCRENDGERLHNIHGELGVETGLYIIERREEREIKSDSILCTPVSRS